MKKKSSTITSTTNDDNDDFEEEEEVAKWLVALRPSNVLVYLRDGSVQTSVRAALLR